MAKITIRMQDDKIIDALDEIVIKENYESRNQLICEILELYIGTKNSFITNALPTIINNLCMDSISHSNAASEKMYDNIVPILKKLLDQITLISLAIGIEPH